MHLRNHGSSSNDPVIDTSGTVTISGKAVDEPIIGATVSVFSMDEKLLGSTTTDSEGYYSIDVNEADIESGYVIVVNGGQMNGTPFNGELKAYYGPSEVKNKANVTLITTVISQCLENADGSTILVKRDNAIQLLADIGMCKADQWASLTPELVDLDALRPLVQQMGVSEWVTQLSEDLNDNDLSAQMMTGFPYAHGGISVLSIAEENNRISVLPGDSIDEVVNVNGQNGNSKFTYEFVNSPEGMQVNEQGHITYTLSGDTTEESENPFEVKVINSQNGFGRILHGTLSILSFNSVDNDEDGYTENQGDCNDKDAAIHPEATEICGDSIDQDCNGEDLACSDVDNDEDGYTENQGDCNDEDAAIHPEATEICGDSIDQDCNGEDLACSDVDNDEDGYTENQGDCNDDDAAIHPGATDICDDGVDQDCDGSDLTCYVDDGNYYDGNDSDDDGDGYTENQGDCNDNDSTIHPGATEIYNCLFG